MFLKSAINLVVCLPEHVELSFGFILCFIFLCRSWLHPPHFDRVHHLPYLSSQECNIKDTTKNKKGLRRLVDCAVKPSVSHWAKAGRTFWTRGWRGGAFPSRPSWHKELTSSFPVKTCHRSWSYLNQGTWSAYISTLGSGTLLLAALFTTSASFSESTTC